MNLHDRRLNFLLAPVVMFSPTFLIISGVATPDIQLNYNSVELQFLSENYYDRMRTAWKFIKILLKRAKIFCLEKVVNASRSSWYSQRANPYSGFLHCCWINLLSALWLLRSSREDVSHSAPSMMISSKPGIDIPL